MNIFDTNQIYLHTGMRPCSNLRILKSTFFFASCLHIYESRLFSVTLEGKKIPLGSPQQCNIKAAVVITKPD